MRDASRLTIFFTTKQAKFLYSDFLGWALSTVQKHLAMAMVVVVGWDVWDRYATPFCGGAYLRYKSQAARLFVVAWDVWDAWDIMIMGQWDYGTAPRSMQPRPTGLTEPICVTCGCTVLLLVIFRKVFLKALVNCDFGLSSLAILEKCVKLLR